MFQEKEENHVFCKDSNHYKLLWLILKKKKENNILSKKKNFNLNISVLKIAKLNKIIKTIFKLINKLPATKLNGKSAIRTLNKFFFVNDMFLINCIRFKLYDIYL